MRKLCLILALVAAVAGAQTSSNFPSFDELYEHEFQTALDHWIIISTIVSLQGGYQPRVLVAKNGDLSLYSDGTWILALRGFKYLIVPFDEGGKAMIFRLLGDNPVRIDKSYTPRVISL